MLQEIAACLAAGDWSDEEARDAPGGNVLMLLADEGFCFQPAALLGQRGKRIEALVVGRIENGRRFAAPAAVGVVARSRGSALDAADDLLNFAGSGRVEGGLVLVTSVREQAALLYKSPTMQGVPIAVVYVGPVGGEAVDRSSVGGGKRKESA